MVYSIRKTTAFAKDLAISQVFLRKDIEVYIFLCVVRLVWWRWKDENNGERFHIET